MVDEIDHGADKSRVPKFILGDEKLTSESGGLGGSGYPGCSVCVRQAWF
jgi:hypothetical protein